MQRISRLVVQQTDLCYHCNRTNATFARYANCIIVTLQPVCTGCRACELSKHSIHELTQEHTGMHACCSYQGRAGQLSGPAFADSVASSGRGGFATTSGRATEAAWQSWRHVRHSSQPAGQALKQQAAAMFAKSLCCSSSGQVRSLQSPPSSHQ